MQDITRVAVIGLGAVGASCAQLISQYAPGVELYGVVRNLELYWGNPILINNKPLKINYRTIDSLSGIPLDLILVCVKSYQLEDAITSMRELVSSNTIIMSLMNGMKSGERLSTIFGKEHIIYSTLMNSDINRSGRYVTLNKFGTIYYGSLNNSMQKEIQKVHTFLNKSHITNEVSSNIKYHLWKKLMIMAGFAQTSTVYQMTFGAFLKNDKAMDVMRTAQREIVELANKHGVPLSEHDISQWERSLRKLSSDGRSSMLQDYWTNRRLEIDVLGDYICEIGEHEGIALPTNQWLCEQIHKMLSKRAELPIGNLETKGLQTRKTYIAAPEKIANQIRMDIIMAKIARGDKIGENELSERFQASRSSVRTALQIISSEGMLEVLPNGRREVIGFSSRQVENLYDTRSLLENRALEIIFRKKNTVHPELANILGKIEKKYNSRSDYEDWGNLDIQFHRALICSAENLFLFNAWNSMVHILYALLQLSSVTQKNFHYASEFFGKHRHLYELLLANDKAIFPELKRHIDEEKEISASIVSGFQ